MLKVVRTELNKAIANMEEVFSGTKEVIAKYQAEKSLLDEKEDHLNQYLRDLQNDHTANVVSQQNTTDISEVIYLQKQSKELVNESRIIESLLEDLEGERLQLKLRYAPLIQGAYEREMAKAQRQFDVNDEVDNLLYQLVLGISDYAHEVRKQHNAMIPIVEEFLDSGEVLEANKRFNQVFSHENGNLPYWQTNKTVLHREDIRLACGGNVPPEIRPKEVK
ncbi:hypothetical protein AB1K84_25280 [Mesobacillus foraminis]|uniref:hypothetical protein n=1 Tax=Mesobacillus foraminis TaxID=279826 RepID=UPI0039A25A52